MPDQSLLAGLGWLAAGVPAAGLWTLLALLLSTAQVGVFLVSVPILALVDPARCSGEALDDATLDQLKSLGYVQ